MFTLGSRIILTLFLPVIILSAWGIYNMKATNKMIQLAEYEIMKWQHRRKLNHEHHGGNMDYEIMIYDFRYLFLRPWIKSAVRPRYREVLKEWII
jgi:heme/copper-type cytochrome/quinol oxidase subunit 2